MSKHKLCTFQIGPCHMKVAIVPDQQWEELKDEYRGFEVSDIDYDQTETEFFKLWPNGLYPAIPQ